LNDLITSFEKRISNTESSSTTNNERVEIVPINNRATYDIAKNLYRSRTYFKNIKDNIFPTIEHISGDIRSEHISDRHLSLIRKHWQLLRVQHNILGIQVRSADRKGSKPSFSKTSVQGYEGQRKLLCPNEQLQFDTLESIEPEHYSSRSTSRNSQLSWTSLSSMEEVSDVADAKIYMKPKSPSVSVQNSPRDDGYYSKAGESTAEEAYSFTDTQSVETDGTMQVCRKKKNLLFDADL